LIPEVVQDGDPVALEDRNVMIQIFALEGVGDDGLVLDADLVRKAAAREGLNGAFELPRCGVRGGKRQIPGEIVLQDGRLACGERARHTGQIDEAIDVRKNRVRRDPEYRDPRFHLPLATCVFSTTGSSAYC